MKMVYAESWMIDALKAAHLPPTALLDLPVLLDTLSPKDVAFYLAMNRSLTEFLPKDLVASFSPIDVRLELLGDHPKAQRVADALRHRQYAKGAVPPRANDSDYKLTCDLLDPDTLVFQHILKSDPSLSANYYASTLLERVLRQMYTTLSFEKLVVLPVFRWWMELRQQALIPNKVV